MACLCLGWPLTPKVSPSSWVTRRKCKAARPGVHYSKAIALQRGDSTVTDPVGEALCVLKQERAWPYTEACRQLDLPVPGLAPFDQRPVIRMLLSHFQSSRILIGPFECPPHLGSDHLIRARPQIHWHRQRGLPAPGLAFTPKVSPINWVTRRSLIQSARPGVD